MSVLKQNIIPFPQHRASREPAAPTSQDRHDMDMIEGMRFLGILEHFECVLTASIARRKKHKTIPDHKKLVS